MEKIYLYGAGSFFKSHKGEILEKYDIVAYIDNQISKEQSSLDGIPVYGIEVLKELDEYPVMVMIKHFVGAAYELLHMDVNWNRIKLGITLYPENEQEMNLVTLGSFSCVENSIQYVMKDNCKYPINENDDLKRLFSTLLASNGNEESTISVIRKLGTVPVCREFGLSRGTPVDRIYVEKFLDDNKEVITGDVLEIADNEYTLKYGDASNLKSHILHVKGWGNNVINGNLETGEGLRENMFDAAIITQTLMFIFDLKSVAENIYKILKPGGVALITVNGVSQISRYDADNWGSYWGIHQDALNSLFIPIFGEGNVQVETYGNVKIASAMMYGICAEELEASDFDYDDRDYPIICAAKLIKRI